MSSTQFGYVDPIDSIINDQQLQNLVYKIQAAQLMELGDHDINIGGTFSGDSVANL